MAMFIVDMLRHGDPEDHSYLISKTFKSLPDALEYGEKERLRRGGKYTPDVYLVSKGNVKRVATEGKVLELLTQKQKIILDYLLMGETRRNISEYTNTNLGELSKILKRIEAKGYIKIGHYSREIELLRDIDGRSICQ